MDEQLDDQWRLTTSKAFPAIFWTPFEHHRIACNGFVIGPPENRKPLEFFATDFRHRSTCVMDPEGRFPMDVTRMRAPLPSTFVPGFATDLYADILAFCLAALSLARTAYRSVPDVGYPRNGRGICADSYWNNISDDKIAAMMWMSSEAGAAIIDRGLIYESALNRIAVVPAFEPLVAVPDHITLHCPTASNDPLLKTKEWLGVELGYIAADWNVDRGQRIGTQRIVYADGEWTSEFKRLGIKSGGNSAVYKNLRTEFPELKSIIGIELSDLVPVETPLSRVWMDLLQKPFVPFDAHHRAKLIDGLPTKYRDWVGKWRRHIEREGPFSSLKP